MTTTSYVCVRVSCVHHQQCTCAHSRRQTSSKRRSSSSNQSQQTSSSSSSTSLHSSLVTQLRRSRGSSTTYHQLPSSCLSIHLEATSCSCRISKRQKPCQPTRTSRSLHHLHRNFALIRKCRLEASAAPPPLPPPSVLRSQQSQPYRISTMLPRHVQCNLPWTITTKPSARQARQMTHIFSPSTAHRMTSIVSTTTSTRSLSS
mmetsp:Transcript_4629/g.10357  ORF Transcript_4629/g.10357 Transcript_4629/m.10357 type:complete len:203 (+) Transcript_4629:183-791(+)